MLQPFYEGICVACVPTHGQTHTSPPFLQPSEVNTLQKLSQISKMLILEK